MRRAAVALIALLGLLLFAACGAGPVEPAQATEPTAAETAGPEQTSNLTVTEPTKPETTAAAEETEKTMILTVNEQTVPVLWESNESTAELRRQAAQGAITVALSPYGGFEQVGSLGRSYPANDARLTTKNGDIVLYASDQIVLFYGENTWAYTRLGKIDLPADEVTRLLTQERITLTLSVK